MNTVLRVRREAQTDELIDEGMGDDRSWWWWDAGSDESGNGWVDVATRLAVRQRFAVLADRGQRWQRARL